MKLSVVYKSIRKTDTYLYVKTRDDFSAVPEVLMKQFGEPKFVMLLSLANRDIVAGIKKDKLVEKIESDGYYLQLPPKLHSLLEGHLSTAQKSGTAQKISTAQKSAHNNAE